MREREPGRGRRFQMRDTMLLSGWLFADLFLALFVIFLAANTAGITLQPTPTVVPTPTPTPKPTPKLTPTPAPILELVKHRLHLPIDSDGLLNDSPTARQSLIQEVTSQAVLQGRVVGFVIVYGNASDDSQINQAENVAVKVIDALKTIGRQFARASYYDPLYSLGSDPNFIEIDLYLYSQ